MNTQTLTQNSAALRSRWIERRASRLASAYGLSRAVALQEAEIDYRSFFGLSGNCEPCAACALSDSPAQRPSAAQASAEARDWICKLLMVLLAVLLIFALGARA